MSLYTPLDKKDEIIFGRESQLFQALGRCLGHRAEKRSKRWRVLSDPQYRAGVAQALGPHLFLSLIDTRSTLA